MENLNESIERVVVSEYIELSKFYENFSKIPAKSSKYLTLHILGGTTNATKNYGLLELLSRCDGLVFLQLYIS